MTRTARTLLTCVLALPVLFPGFALGGTISLPLSIEREFLHSLVIRDFFSDPGGTALLLDEQGGCKKVVLSEPGYTLRSGRILLETKVFVRAGFHVAGTCILPLSWEGYVSLTQVPFVNDHWVLSFKTIDSRVYDGNHQPAHIMGFVWDLIKSHVFTYLNQITINLAPPVEELRGFMMDIFPPTLQDRAAKMVDSLRLGKVNALPEAVAVEVLVETEEGMEPEAPGGGAFLSPEELGRFVAAWETWDAYFVHLLTSLPGSRLTEEERKVLLDVLLETRHRFVDELTEPVGKMDVVRQEFVAAWKRLSPLFRRRLIEEPGHPLLDYLAFFTASDALVALDRIGPDLGLEISRDGLVRLARLIGKRDVTDLPYGYGMDTELRDLLGMDPPLPASGPSMEDESIEMESEEREEEPEDGGTISLLKGFFLGTAWAQPEEKRHSLERLRPWLVPEGDIRPYLERVRSLLNQSSREAFRKAALPEGSSAWHGSLVLSTAWQESCFRHFTVQDGHVSYLKSSNRTSVGMMQVNERVWRGVYDERHLRWDVAYNAAAGCEILSLYLKKYALPEIEGMQAEDRPDPQALARMVYAMYSGGPGQLRKFLSRLKRDRPNLVDRLFLEKYQWVTGGEWDKIDKCLS